LLGDHISTNVFLLGFAYQKGYLPLKTASLEEAIRLNNVAVEMNLRAFAWGRVAAHEPDRLVELVGPQNSSDAPAFNFDQFIETRVQDLTAYQNAAYAERCRSHIESVIAAEEKVDPGRLNLAEAVARALYKLMAYKDEYEVARLYTDGRYLEKLRAQFDGDYKLKFNFAPPLFAAKDRVTGQPLKKEYGAFMWQALKILAPLKILRGTPLDPFGYLAERQEERALIRDYENLLDEIVAGLAPDNYQTAIELASLPLQIRGFGPVKTRAIEVAKTEKLRLLAAFRHSSKISVQAAE